MPHHIKDVGTSEVDLRFAEDVSVKVRVTVVRDQEGSGESGETEEQD